MMAWGMGYCKLSLVQYCGHVGNPAIDHRNLHRFRPRGHVNDKGLKKTT